MSSTALDLCCSPALFVQGASYVSCVWGHGLVGVTCQISDYTGKNLWAYCTVVFFSFIFFGSRQNNVEVI